MHAEARAWHRANRIPKNATMDQRIAWHKAHAKVCGCREMPASVKAEIERREGDYRLENDPRFLSRVEKSRASLRAGRGVRLGDVE